MRGRMILQRAITWDVAQKPSMPLPGGIPVTGFRDAESEEPRDPPCSLSNLTSWRALIAMAGTFFEVVSIGTALCYCEGPNNRCKN